LTVSLRDSELENSGSREESSIEKFEYSIEKDLKIVSLPATVLRRLKIVRGSERGDRLLQVACQVSALEI